MSSLFKFKNFEVRQDKCAMKIGTDAVLLGAWCSLNMAAKSILDIGSGTGVIALQLAQRSKADLIDAVELDENAFEQCVENFEMSDWSDRLFCYHSSFEDFALEMHKEKMMYDLIVSNPPFYTDDFESKNSARNNARFTSSLEFENLIFGVEKILSVNGFFSVIIPFKEEANFIKLCNHKELFLHKRCRVKGNLNSAIKRSLLEFTKVSNTTIQEEEIVIEIERHIYTREYIRLVKDFYLKM